jgi:hypothetical protein
MLQQEPKSFRDQIINSYLTTIETSFRENISQLKLINYGTGSGKTYQFSLGMSYNVDCLIVVNEAIVTVYSQIITRAFASCNIIAQFFNHSI